MAQTTNYTKVYKKWTSNPKLITSMGNVVKRGAFYQIVEYKYVENEDDSKTWSQSSAPIIYVLYASKKDDLLHCLKISYINPLTVKQLFKKLVDEKDKEIDPGRNARSFYANQLNEARFFTKNFYRTYKLSGIVKALEIEMDISNLVPKAMVNSGQVSMGYKTYKRRGGVENVDINKEDNKLKSYKKSG
jgi:hypothetical protein